MSNSVFNYFSVSTLWALMPEFIAVLTFFCTIGTVLDLMYFSTAVASAGCFFFFFFLVDASLPVLKFWVIIYFSLFYRRVWLGSMLDFPYVNNTRLLDIFLVFSDTHYPLTVGNIDIFISSVMCLKGLIYIWCVGKCFECVPHCILSENSSTIRRMVIT